MSEKVKFLVETTRADLSAKLFQIFLRDNVEGYHTVTEYKPDIEKSCKDCESFKNKESFTHCQICKRNWDHKDHFKLIARAEGKQ